MEDKTDSPSSEPLIQRSSSLGERFRHLFGIHAWEQKSVDGRTREFCIGCHRERTAVARFRPPADFPSQPPPAQSKTPEAEEENTPFQFPPREETRESPPSRTPDRKPQGDLASVWRWIVGLRMWVKIMGAFIALQVIGSIVTLFTGGD